MPPKADYWQYFVVQGVLTVCQLPGCSNPNVSLGALPKAGEKKRISEYIFYTITAHYHWCFHSATGGVSNHLSKHHKEVWEAYSETRLDDKGKGQMWIKGSKTLNFEPFQWKVSTKGCDFEFRSWGFSWFTPEKGRLSKDSSVFMLW